MKKQQNYMINLSEREREAGLHFTYTHVQHKMQVTDTDINHKKFEIKVNENIIIYHNFCIVGKAVLLGKTYHGDHLSYINFQPLC